MYVIESNDPYTRRPEYLSGFDEVTRRALWTKDQAQALQLAAGSAASLASEALLGRAAKTVEVAPADVAAMHDRIEDQDADSFEKARTIVQLVKALEKAEAFMAGFEDDESQETLTGDLAEVRAAIAAGKAGRP